MKGRTLSPKDFTLDYILARRDVLLQTAAGRNARFDLYERMYRMDVWNEPMGEDEYRVTLPIAYDVTEKTRALLITRPPVITVPYPSSDADRQEQAQVKEAFLYGVMSVTNFMQELADAEWYADCLGRGWLKCVHDSYAYEDEVPIVITAPDPRTVYYQLSPRKDRCVELVHTWERSRREVEAEWGSLSRPEAMELEREAEWLDEKVTYIEYWCEVAAWETVEPEPEPEPEMTMVDRAAEIFLQAAGSGFGAADMVPPQPEPVEEVEPERRRVRKILHAVLIEDGLGGVGDEAATVDLERGKFLKKPMFVPGYKSIPFFGWSGVSTPLRGKNADLSVLFPLSNGDCVDENGAKKAMGLLAAWNLLLSVNLQEAFHAANSAFNVDDPDAAVDLRSGALNYTRPGTQVKAIYGGNVNQGSMAMTESLQQQVSRVSIPGVWDGNPQSLSGQAISGFATAYQMILGQKQHNREVALSAMCSHILCMAKQYAAGGWTAWGFTATGGYVEETITPEDIGDDYRAIVKLSASMPKDDVGTISLLSTLQGKNQISMETFLDQFQKVYGLAADTPTDELKRIARDMVLSQGEIAKGLATYFAQDYIALLTGTQGGIPPEDLIRSIQLKMQAEVAPPQPQGPPGAASPTGGMPPSAVPPTPEMLAAVGNLGGAMNMQAGQQTMPPNGMPPMGG